MNYNYYKPYDIHLLNYLVLHKIVDDGDSSAFERSVEQLVAGNQSHSVIEFYLLIKIYFFLNHFDENSIIH